MIRPMESGDLPAVADLEKESFSEPWSRELISAGFAHSLDHFWVLQEEESGEIRGYMNVRVIAGEGELMRIAVSPLHRGQGYGKKFMDALACFSREQKLSAVTLEVRQSNDRAINLYKAYGFQIEAVRESYYHNPTEDALIMWNRSI